MKFQNISGAVVEYCPKDMYGNGIREKYIIGPGDVFDPASQDSELHTDRDYVTDFRKQHGTQFQEMAEETAPAETPPAPSGSSVKFTAPPTET